MTRYLCRLPVSCTVPWAERVRKGEVRDALRVPGYSFPITTRFTLSQGLGVFGGKKELCSHIEEEGGMKARISIEWVFVELRSGVKWILLVGC